MTQDKDLKSGCFHPMLYWHFVGGANSGIVPCFEETLHALGNKEILVQQRETAFANGIRREYALTLAGSPIAVVLDVLQDPLSPLPALEMLPQFYFEIGDCAESLLLSRYDTDNPMCALSLEDAAKYLNIPYQFDETRPVRETSCDRGVFGTMPGSAAHFLIGRGLTPEAFATFLTKATDILWRRWDIARECVARHNTTCN